jgi:hypothetical protein
MAMIRGVLVPACVLAAVLAARICGAGEADKKEAKRHFEAGLALVETEDFGAAASEFESSVRLFPTKMGLFNLANAYKALHRYGEALDTVRRLETEFAGKIEPDLAAEINAFHGSMEGLVGRLVVRVTQAGASVKVDGRAVGKTPLQDALILGPGAHEIEVSLGGHATEKQTVPVESRGKSEIVLTLRRLQGSVKVTTSVEGARVLLDGKEVGRTPLASPLATEPGRHAIRLEREGYEATQRDIDVTAGQEALLVVAMAKLAPAPLPPAPAKAAPAEPAPKPQPPPKTAQEETRSPTMKALGWTGLALTLAAGAASGACYGLAAKRAADFDDATKDYEVIQKEMEGGNTTELLDREAKAWSKLNDARDDADLYQKLGLGFGVAAGALAVATVVVFFVKSPEGESEPRVSATPDGLKVSF